MTRAAQFILVTSGEEGQVEWAPMPRHEVEDWLRLAFAKPKGKAAAQTTKAQEKERMAALVRRFLDVAQPGQFVILPTGALLIRVVDDLAEARSPENGMNFGYDHWTGVMLDYRNQV